MWIRSHWEYPAQSLLWGIAIAASLAAAATDIRSRRIPNYLTGPVLLGGLVFSGLAMGFGGLVDAVVGSFAMMFVFILLFLIAGGGAGDAKLMGALGAWLGTVNGLFALGGVLFAGALLAVGVSLAKGRLRQVLKNTGSIVVGLLWVVIGRGRLLKVPEVAPVDARVGAKIPYGAAIFAGVTSAAIGVWIWRAMS